MAANQHPKISRKRFQAASEALKEKGLCLRVKPSPETGRPVFMVHVLRGQKFETLEAVEAFIYQIGSGHRDPGRPQ